MDFGKAFAKAALDKEGIMSTSAAQGIA